MRSTQKRHSQMFAVAAASMSSPAFKSTFLTSVPSAGCRVASLGKTAVSTVWHFVRYCPHFQLRCTAETRRLRLRGGGIGRRPGLGAFDLELTRRPMICRVKEGQSNDEARMTTTIDAPGFGVQRETLHGIQAPYLSYACVRPCKLDCLDWRSAPSGVVVGPNISEPRSHPDALREQTFDEAADV
jgi:hypothetical protein